MPNTLYGIHWLAYCLNTINADKSAVFINDPLPLG